MSQLYFENIDNKIATILNGNIPALEFEKQKLEAERIKNEERQWHLMQAQNLMSELVGKKGNQGYEKDSALIGNIAEEAYIHYLQYMGHKIISRPTVKDPTHDLITEFEGKRYKHEIKADLKKAQTKRVAIEESRYDKFTGELILTGIHVWDGHFVSYFLPDERAVVRHGLKKLRFLWEFAKKNKIGKLYEKGGEDNRTNNYCVPQEYFKFPSQFTKGTFDLPEMYDPKIIHL